MKNTAIMLIMSMLLVLFPQYVDAAMVESEKLINFDEAAKDLAYFDVSRDGIASLSTGYNGNCLAVKCTDKMSYGENAVMRFEKASREIRITQTILVSAEEADITVMADNTNIIRVNFAGERLSVLSKEGWTHLQTYIKGIWYKIEIVADITTGKFYVCVDNMKIGGEFDMIRNVGYANRLKYNIKGNGEGKINVDDIIISTKGIKNNISTMTVSGTVPTPTMKPLPYYEVSEIGIESTGIVGNEPVWSSSSETGSEYKAENVLLKDESVWRAGAPSEVEDKGVSMKFSKPEEGAMQLATYSFEPIEGICIIEQDFIVGENVGQKALPYIYDSDGNHVLSVLLNNANMATNTGKKIISDFNTDQWYSVKYELNTYSKTATIYVDGEIVQKDIPFRTNAENVAKVQYHMASNQKGEMYIDNFNVYYMTSLGNRIDICSEDFDGYTEGEGIFSGWQTSNGNGKITADRYTIADAANKYPQSFYIDLTREGRLEQTEITFPENTNYKYSVWISRNNSYYVEVANHANEFCSGIMRDAFAPVGARYIRITLYEGIDNNGKKIPAQIQNLNAFWFKRIPESNVAFTANIEVSSENTSVYDRRGLTDNIVAEFGNIGEWQSLGETNPTAKLYWDNPHTVDRIILHDRASLDSNIKQGTLNFSDGTSLEITDIPDTGAPKEIKFKEKTITWVSFTATGGEGNNIGLSEFQVFKAGENPELPEYIEPWKKITINTEYGGRWIVSDDLDNDGSVDVLSARSININGGGGTDGMPYYEVHEVCSVAAQDIDGNLLWTWGTSNLGQVEPAYDVPCIIYDLDNDGNKEVLLCTSTHLVILNGQTGTEVKKYQLPTSSDYPLDWASDCINIANISGNDYPSDIIIKNRYFDIWAFTKDWKELWHVGKINGYRTSHQPWVIDIDNDGCDEVLSSYSLIDDDGTVLWSLKQENFKADIKSGHQDSIKAIVFDLIGDVDKNEVINNRDSNLLYQYLSGEAELTEEQKRNADTNGDGAITEADVQLLEKRVKHEIKAFPNKGLSFDDIRLCLCFCGAYEVAMIDGNGKLIWAAEDGLHHETVMTGDVIPENEGLEIITNPTFKEENMSGNCGVFIFSQNGEVLGERYGYQFNRYTQTFNWTGTDEDYIIMPTDNIVINGRYEVKVKPLSPLRGFCAPMMFCMPIGDTRYAGDMDGDGTTDINLIINTGNGFDMYIYKNPNGKKIADAVGTGPNFSLY